MDKIFSFVDGLGFVEILFLIFVVLFVRVVYTVDAVMKDRDL